MVRVGDRLRELSASGGCVRFGSIELGLVDAARVCRPIRTGNREGSATRSRTGRGGRLDSGLYIR